MRRLFALVSGLAMLHLTLVGQLPCAPDNSAAATPAQAMDMHDMAMSDSHAADSHHESSNQQTASALLRGHVGLRHQHLDCRSDPRCCRTVADRRHPDRRADRAAVVPDSPRAAPSESVAPTTDNWCSRSAPRCARMRSARARIRCAELPTSRECCVFYYAL